MEADESRLTVKLYPTVAVQVHSLHHILEEGICIFES